VTRTTLAGVVCVALLALVACSTALATPQRCGPMTAPVGDPLIKQVRVEHLHCPRVRSGEQLNFSAELAGSLDETELEDYPRYPRRFHVVIEPYEQPSQSWLCSWRRVLVGAEVGTKVGCGYKGEFIEVVSGP
jgi:hypothetical protein